MLNRVQALNELALSDGATNEEIKKQFKKLAIQYHPDKLSASQATQEEINKSQEKFKNISNAHQYLLEGHRS